jgi:hypothetical protein
MFTFVQIRTPTVESVSVPTLAEPYEVTRLGGCYNIVREECRYFFC